MSREEPGEQAEGECQDNHGAHGVLLLLATGTTEPYPDGFRDGGSAALTDTDYLKWTAQFSGNGCSSSSSRRPRSLKFSSW